MARTISQIAGEFGLRQNATEDPFAQAEQATLENIQRSLQDIRSQTQEAAQARGFGRSSFTEGIQARQEADILGQTFESFARARQDETLRERQFGRDIISQQIGADITSRQIQEQAGAESQLIGARGEQERQTLSQRILGEQQLEAVRGAQSRETLAQQLTGEVQLEELRGAEKRKSLETQSDLQLEQQRQQQAGQQTLARIQGEEARELEGLRGTQAIGLVQEQNRAQLSQLNQQFLNESQLVQQRFDTIMKNLPEELRLKAEYEKDVLQKELEVRREQQVVDIAIQTIFKYANDALGENFFNKEQLESLL